MNDFQAGVSKGRNFRVVLRRCDDCRHRRRQVFRVSATIGATVTLAGFSGFLAAYPNSYETVFGCCAIDSPLALDTTTLVNFIMRCHALPCGNGFQGSLDAGIRFHPRKPGRPYRRTSWLPRRDLERMEVKIGGIYP